MAFVYRESLGQCKLGPSVSAWGGCTAHARRGALNFCILAVGGLAVGGLAVGGLAVGGLAVGGLAVGDLQLAV